MKLLVEAAVLVYVHVEDSKIPKEYLDKDFDVESLPVPMRVYDDAFDAIKHNKIAVIAGMKILNITKE